MVIIEYLRWWCRPTITNIYLRSTCWWWLLVDLILIDLILIIARIFIILRISSRSHRSYNSRTNSLARPKKYTARLAEGCFATWR